MERPAGADTVVKAPEAPSARPRESRRGYRHGRSRGGRLTISPSARETGRSNSVGPGHHGDQVLVVTVGGKRTVGRLEAGHRDGRGQLGHLLKRYGAAAGGLVQHQPVPAPGVWLTGGGRLVPGPTRAA